MIHTKPGSDRSLFNLTAFLTRRDAWAGDLSELLTEKVPRTDAPLHFAEPHPPQKPWTPPPHLATSSVNESENESENEGEGDRRRHLSALGVGGGDSRHAHCSSSGGGGGGGSEARQVHEQQHTCAGLGEVTAKQRNQMVVLGTLTGVEVPAPHGQLDYDGANRWLWERWRSWSALKAKEMEQYEQ